MFDKVKELQKFKKAQSEIKKQLEQIFVSYQKGNITILVRGDKHVEKISIGDVENKDLKEAINDAMKQADKKAEKQLRGQLGDLGIPGL